MKQQIMMSLEGEIVIDWRVEVIKKYSVRLDKI